MAIRTEFAFFNLIITLLLFAGIAVLQIFLSRRQSRFAGLALPLVTLFVSFVFPFSMAVPPEGVDVGFVFSMVGVWLAANIPTVILLAIYLACRPSSRRNRPIDKMNIRDL